MTNTATAWTAGDQVQWVAMPATEDAPKWVRSGTLRERHNFGDNTVWLIETETGPATASEAQLGGTGR